MTANSHFRKGAQIGALLLVGLGIVVLIGWAGDIAWLKSMFPRQVSVKANTAICFLCSGTALLFQLKERGSRVSRILTAALSLVIVAIGVLTFAEYASHRDLGIDQSLFIDRAQVPFPGRMSPAGAINFCVAGIGLLFLTLGPRARRAAQIPAVFNGFSAMLAVIGYLYGVSPLHGPFGYHSMSLQAGLGLLVLAWTMLSCGPQDGLLSVIHSDRPAGWLSRTLLFAAVVLPFILGFAAIRASKAGPDARLTVAALVVCQIVLFTVLIWLSASRLDASEEEEEMAKEALAASEQMLQQSQKMEAIGVLAGGLAHDFNNLLNVISGYSELLLKDKLLQPTQRSKVEKISKAGQTAAALTRQLLAFSRQQVLQPKAIDLNHIVGGSDGYLPRLIKANIEFSTTLDPALMATVIDPTQLEQILLNLVVNACDAMPEGGKLTIETANVVLEEPMAAEKGVHAGHFVRLTITDTGVGMSEETRAHIFEPFFTTKAIGKGTGLGLATVYGIVKQSGGFIQVESKPGRGTTFIVYLPATRIAAPAEPQKTEKVESGGGTILVVEDSELMRELVLETLESMGYTALVAKDGQQAIRICNQFAGTIDLLLSDVVMPRMGGPEVMKKVKQIRPEIAVLFMSGYTSDVTIRHGVSNTEISFIQKPFSSTELMHKVREAMVRAQERNSVRNRLNAAMANRPNSLTTKDVD